jgi:hemolysin activation/secretion protein
MQGQASDSPLINSEQYAGGGLNTVRGYLESAALGDSGGFGTFELRSPSFFGTTTDKNSPVRNEWRAYCFVDGGRLMLNQPLPEQKDRFDLASVGVGSRMKLFGHLNASVDAAWPLVSQGTTLAHDVFVTFRVWADF